MGEQNAVQANSLLCTSADYCAAGGRYRDGDGHFQAFVVTERNGTWRRAYPDSRLGLLNQGGSGSVSSVACVSARTAAPEAFTRTARITRRPWSSAGPEAGQRMQLIRAAAAGAILAAALSSCSSSAGAGPLWHPMDRATQCVPARGNKVLTDGLEPIQNRAMTTAVIDKVAFTNPKGLRVIRAYVVPDNGSLYGVLYGYPPEGAADLGFTLIGFHWNRRQNAAGARLPHMTTMNLLLVFRLVAGVARSTAAGIDVWYHVGNTHYHLRSETALVVLTKRRSCF